MLFFSKDLFRREKQDQIGQYIFDKNNLFKSRKIHKLPLPSRAKIIPGEDVLQVMNISYPRILHREMQLGGEIGQETEYLLGMEYDYAHPVKLSFDSDRVLFLAVENEFYEITIDKTGRVTKRNLLIQLNAVHKKHSFFPEAGGILPWGYTDNGDELYWKTNEDARMWSIIVYESRSWEYHEYPMSMTEFLFGIVSRNLVCDAFPEDFPSEDLEFISGDAE